LYGSANKLVKAGIKAEGREAYELANGEAVEYPYGFARVEFMGAETVGQVISALKMPSRFWV
jgi:hypothetical protein